jgi:hypothetical protein
MRTFLTKSILLAAGLAVAACQDLDVTNTNSPDRDRALSQPSDVETLIASTWRDLWTRWQNDATTYNLFPVVSDAFTATYANNAALELSSEPRVAFNNNPLSDAHGVARASWEGFLKAVSSANDGLAAIEKGLIIRTGTPLADNTTRARIFAMMNRSIAYGYIAMLFDRSMIVDEKTDISTPTAIEYKPHAEVMASAISGMQTTIALAQQNNVTLPNTWINGIAWTSADMVKVMNSYLARFLVYNARTPQERAAVNWTQVLDYISKGITADYAVTLLSGTLTSGYLSRLQQTGTFSAWGDYKMIGPADVSGTYQAWLAKPVGQRDRFLITTPDRRITGATPTSNGTYFRYRADNIFRPERGTYHHSHYQWFRNAGRTNSGTYAIMSMDEMNLLKAEALIRLDRAAEAVPLINITRTRTQRIGTTDFPGLPAVTVDGVPAGETCVPKRLDGTCGTLMDALIYERQIENSGLDNYMAYLDARGFGKLLTGTFLMMPVPARELATVGIPIYSFGGVGGPGAAQ